MKTAASPPKPWAQVVCFPSIAIHRSTPMRIIAVTPVQGGWCVRSDLSACALMFLSRAGAMAQARRLAELSATLGEAATMFVRDEEGPVQWRASWSTKARGAHRFGPPAVQAARSAEVTSQRSV